MMTCCSQPVTLQNNSSVSSLLPYAKNNVGYHKHLIFPQVMCQASDRHDDLLPMFFFVWM